MAIINGQRIKYGLTFDAGGYVEDDDIEVLKQMRLLSPGTIKAIRMHYTIENDLTGTEFNWADDANAAIYGYVQIAIDDTNNKYQLQPHETLLNPQPDGLND